MHEIKLVENIIAILDKEVSSPEVGEVKTVYLEIGEMHHVTPEIISSCFKKLPKADKLEKARMDVNIVPVRLKCASCGDESVPEDGTQNCRVCGSENVEIISGRELEIRKIEW